MACDIICPDKHVDTIGYRRATLTLLQTICTNLDLIATDITDVETMQFYDNDGAGNLTPFLRNIITALDGTRTVLDTTLDGTTPYVVTGTVEPVVGERYAGDVWYDDSGIIKQAKSFYVSGDPSTLSYRDSVTNVILVTPTLVNDPLDSAHDTIAITPSDVADLPQVVDWIMVGSDGSVNFTTTGGSNVPQAGLASGQYVWSAMTKVWATGTTATGIVGYISR